MCRSFFFDFTSLSSIVPHFNSLLHLDSFVCLKFIFDIQITIHFFYSVGWQQKRPSNFLKNREIECTLYAFLQMKNLHAPWKRNSTMVPWLNLRIQIARSDLETLRAQHSNRNVNFRTEKNKQERFKIIFCRSLEALYHVHYSICKKQWDWSVKTAKKHFILYCSLNIILSCVRFWSALPSGLSWKK